MSLAVFALKRLGSAVLVLVAVSVLTFLIFFTLPDGDPALRLAGKTATPQSIANIRRAFGFDQPIYVQYLRTMHQILDGSIVSYSQRLPVFPQIEKDWPATLSLAIGGALIWMVIGVVVGLVQALRPGGARDVTLTTLSFVGISAPPFVVGALLLYVLAYRGHLLPSSGYVPLTSNPWQWFLHLVLPWVTLAVLYIGVYAQVLRSGVLDILSADSVRTARAKGLSPRRVLVRHVLRLSLIPLVSLWGLDVAAVVGGATVIVETVFNLQGIGYYLGQSIHTLDVPPVLTLTLLGAALVVVANALVDIVYAALDPRIRS